MGRGADKVSGWLNAGVDFGISVWKELEHGEIRRTLSRDLRELYDFYLDEERRRQLVGMKRFKRWVRVAWWILVSVVHKLPRARRFLLVAALVCSLLGDFKVSQGTVSVSFNFYPLAVLGLLTVLMLELKDKLLARDELEVGRAVQLSLMPDGAPEIPGWEAWLHTHPANDVGGDLVDCVQVADSRWGLVLGDVSGKGLGAALLMAKLQATIRALAWGSDSLAELGGKVNHILHRDGLSGRFATLLYLEVSPSTGRVRVLNAGHMPPIVLGADGVRSLPPVARPLGAFADAAYTEQALDLAPGELLVAYSDGLTDARNEAGEFFGEEGLQALLPRLRGLSSSEAGELIRDAAARFVGDARPADDLSLVTLRRAP
jgi:sigma-B regulation protein RsbU (phosphoserine phosphatase)